MPSSSTARRPRRPAALLLCAAAFAATAAHLGVFTAAISIVDHGIVDQSEPTMSVEGGDLALFCVSDVKWALCEWFHGDTELCKVVDDDQGSGQPCTGYDRVSWNLDTEKMMCGITIKELNRADVGNYKCLLLTTGLTADNEAFSEQAAATIRGVDVAVKAGIEFGGDFEFDDPDQPALVVAALPQKVECTATQAYPFPDVVAALGVENGPITDQDVLLEGDPEDPEAHIEKFGDDTMKVKRTFAFLSNKSDCGKFVKCQAFQADTEGAALFDGAEKVIARKIMIIFPPEPPQGPPKEFGYFAGIDDDVEVTIQFEANPTPENNQAIWHIERDGVVDWVVIEAGQNKTADDGSARPDFPDDGGESGRPDHGNEADAAGDAGWDDDVWADDGSADDVLADDGGRRRRRAAADEIKYVALPLNASGDGHLVTAKLFILKPTEKDADYSYHLNARTQLGDTNYPFKLKEERRATLTPPPTEPSPTDEPPTAPLGAGSIAAIIIIVLAVVVGLALTFWAKSENKWCFKPSGTPKAGKDKDIEYNEVNTVDPAPPPTTTATTNAAPDAPEKPEQDRAANGDTAKEEKKIVDGDKIV